MYMHVYVCVSVCCLAYKRKARYCQFNLHCACVFKQRFMYPLACILSAAQATASTCLCVPVCVGVGVGVGAGQVCS